MRRDSWRGRPWQRLAGGVVLVEALYGLGLTVAITHMTRSLSAFEGSPSSGGVVALLGVVLVGVFVAASVALWSGWLHQRHGIRGVIALAAVGVTLAVNVLLAVLVSVRSGSAALSGTVILALCAAAAFAWSHRGRSTAA